MNKKSINLLPLERAVKALEEGLGAKNLLERDGAFQRFEFTFELSWKTLAKVIQMDRPLEDLSVKNILRTGGEQGLIRDVQKWFELQHARNLTSHTYDPEVAEQVFAIAQQAPKFVHELLDSIRSYLER